MCDTSEIEDLNEIVKSNVKDALAMLDESTDHDQCLDGFGVVDACKCEQDLCNHSRHVTSHPAIALFIATAVTSFVLY